MWLFNFWFNSIIKLEQRLRYGLNISEDEMRNIILEKEEGKPLKKILFTR